MNHIGERIGSRRRYLGLSRLQLAKRLGVSSQTVLNLETDPIYNLGTSLLRRLEDALHVTFDITMKEQRIMNASILMGNDEFILFIRKNHPDCATNNADLGKRIWQRIRDLDATAEIVANGESKPCFWGDAGDHIGDTKLPKTARQFRFKRSLLPELFDHLDALGAERHAMPMPAAAK